MVSSDWVREKMGFRLLVVEIVAILASFFLSLPTTRRRFRDGEPCTAVSTSRSTSPSTTRNDHRRPSPSWQPTESELRHHHLPCTLGVDRLQRCSSSHPESDTPATFVTPVAMFDANDGPAVGVARDRCRPGSARGAPGTSSVPVGDESLAMTTIDATTLEALSKSLVTALCGPSLVAESLVDADLRGHGSHGVTSSRCTR